MPAIRTYPSRTLVDLEHPRLEDVRVEDIAHSLSMLCRYVGHCSDFYSVAEHSLMVEAAAQARWPLLPGEAMAFLMHDAQETYLGDASSPLKLLLPDYRSLEAGWVGFLAKRFDLRTDQPLRCCGVGGHPLELSVNHVDKHLLECEQFTLCWAPDHAFSPDAQKIAVECWSPAEARRRFLRRYHELEAAR